MDLLSVLTNRHGRRREKVFGRGRCIPLDRNAKARITVYARAWSARHKQPGQHRGPLTRAYLEVLHALLWGFHNSRDGRCFPSYEAIAARAQCCRDTVYEAIKALEAAGILTWVNRLVRVQFQEKDLFGVRVELCWNLGDDGDQAALSAGVSMTSTPSWKVMPWMTLGNWFCPLSLRHVLVASVTSLKTMSRAVSCDSAPLVRIVL